MKEINKLKGELAQLKILNKRLVSENEKLKREKDRFVQNESRNLRHELNNVKKKNRVLEKRNNCLEKENNNLKIGPNMQKMIMENLSEINNNFSMVSKKIKQLQEDNNDLRAELDSADWIPTKELIASNKILFRTREKHLQGGIQTIYQRLTKNLEDLVVDPFFYGEQRKLYSRRKQFFLQTYGEEDDHLSFWNNGHNDDAELSTIPYHLVKNIDEVATKFLSVQCHPHSQNFKSIHFERHSTLSKEAFYLFDTNHDLEEIFNLDGIISTFPNLANMIVHDFASKQHPKSLEYMALKTVLRNGVTPRDLPKSLQFKAEHGYFTGESPIPENLSEEGRYWYEVLLTKIGDEDRVYRYSLEQRRKHNFQSTLMLH